MSVRPLRPMPQSRFWDMAFRDMDHRLLPYFAVERFSVVVGRLLSIACRVIHVGSLEVGEVCVKVPDLAPWIREQVLHGYQLGH